MIFRGHRRTRFSSLVALFLFLLTASSFAYDYSQSMSTSSAIWTIGFAGLALLTLFVTLLTGAFLVKALKESWKASKEAKSHAPAGHDSNLLLSLGGWASGLLATVAIGCLILVSLFVMAEADLSSTASISALVIKAGLFGFILLFLYVLFLTGQFLLGVFKSSKEESAHGHVEAGVDAAALTLNPSVTRRSFLSLLGWAWIAFTAATMGALSTMLRFAFPNVTFEPPLKFKVGFPGAFAIGVDNRFKDDHRIWVVRDERGFYVLSTVCTHLGCTPNWLSAEEKFKCPCHGSGFYITGINFEGPAPRPLERFKVTLADDGQIEVDANEKFQQEKGEWTKPGAFLEYRA
jgi:cytochrome b6-f complex iron-sulfur subunit